MQLVIETHPLTAENEKKPIRENIERETSGIFSHDSSKIWKEETMPKRWKGSLFYPVH